MLRGITFLLLSIALVGCGSTGSSNKVAVRADGIHKSIRMGDEYYIEYMRVTEDKKIRRLEDFWGGDEEAIKLLFSENFSPEYSYYHGRKGLSWRAQRGGLSVRSVIKDDGNGFISDSSFLRVVDGKIVEIIDNSRKKISKPITLLDRSGNIATNVDSITISNVNDQNWVISTLDGYYLSDKKGNSLSSKKYSWISHNNNGDLIAAYNGVKFGYLNTRGEEAIPFKFDMAKRMQGEWAVAKVGESLGVIDQKGDFLLSGHFESVDIFPDLRVIAAKQKGHWKFWSEAKGWVEGISGKEYKVDAERGYWQLKKADKWQIMGLDFQPLLPFEVKKFGKVSDNRYVVSHEEGLTGIVDSNGKSMGEPVKGNIFVINGDSDYLLLNIDKKKGILSTDGEVLLEAKNHAVQPVGKGIFVVQANKKGAVRIFAKGKFIDLPNISRVENFNENLLIVGIRDADTKGLLFGLFNKDSLTWAFEPSAYRFSKLNENKFLISQFNRSLRKNLYGIADFSGNVLLEPTYQQIKVIGEKYFCFNSDSKWGLLDAETLEVIVPPEYLGLKEFDEGYIKFKKDTGWGVMDEEFKEVVPAKYTSISFFANYWRVQ